MRESWTDERLDDFRTETARRLDGIDAKLEKIDEKFDRLYQVILLFGGGSIVTFVVGFASLIATQL